MDKTTVYKEAFKTALAVAVVYGLALQLDWMKPYWAAFTVALIALPTAGQSFNKGIMRLAGTVPGCIAGIAILSIAPQDRWLFLFLGVCWVFLATYMTSSTKIFSYFWNIAGVTCLVILTGKVDSSEHVFNSAMFRTLETAMGIVVYMLVSVFLWPRTNLGSIKSTSVKLLNIQDQPFANLTSSREVAEEELDKLRNTQIQLLTKLGQDLFAEGSESYEVSKNAVNWLTFQKQCAALMQELDKWYLSLSSTEKRTVAKILPDLKKKVEAVREEIAMVQAGLSKGEEPPVHAAVKLELKQEELATLGNVDRIIFNGITNHFNEFANVVYQMRITIGDILNDRIPDKKAITKSSQRFWINPNINYESIRGALFASLCLIAGYLIWIYINPPGHQSWILITGALGMVVAGFPQLQAKLLILPLAITCAFGIAVYVFILPHLDAYWQLGLLMLILMFINCSLFKGGPGQLAGTVGIIGMIAITNPQVYSFPALANTYLFLLMGFGTVYLLSLVLDSPRPEKALLKKVDRYFKSLTYLVRNMEAYGTGRLSTFQRWLFNFHQYQLGLIPNSLPMWARFINKKWFSPTSMQDAQSLSNYLQGLTYRMNELIALNKLYGNRLRSDWINALRIWHQKLELVFLNWEIDKTADEVEQIQAQIKQAQHNLEAHISTYLAQEKEQPDDFKEEHLFDLLTGYLGISYAALNYAEVSNKVDWKNWRQEVITI